MAAPLIIPGYLYVGDGFGTGDGGYGTALVLDNTTQNPGGPTGSGYEVPGAMYYNSEFNSFMCGYEQANGTANWGSCTGLVEASSTGVSVNAPGTTAHSFGPTWTMPYGDCYPGVVYQVHASGTAGSATAGYALTIYLQDTDVQTGAEQNIASLGVKNGTNSSWILNMTITCNNMGTGYFMPDGSLYDQYANGTTAGGNWGVATNCDDITVCELKSYSDGSTEGDQLGIGFQWGTSLGSQLTLMTQFTVTRLGEGI